MTAKADLADLKTELKTDIADLKTDVAQLQVRLMTWTAAHWPVLSSQYSN